MKDPTPIPNPDLLILLPAEILELRSVDPGRLESLFDHPEDYLAAQEQPAHLRRMIQGRGAVGYAPIRSGTLTLEDPASYCDFAQEDLLRRHFLGAVFSQRTGFHDHAAPRGPQPKEDRAVVDRLRVKYEEKDRFNAPLNQETLAEVRSDLQATAEVAARNRDVVFHEPHHDLTPGVLLLDEVFRRIVADVGALLAAINPPTATGGVSPERLQPLQDYVRGLYDDRNGQRTTALEQGLRYSRFVDAARPGAPTRVELLTLESWVLAATVIVGAWRGGTHSDGSTIHR